MKIYFFKIHQLIIFLLLAIPVTVFAVPKVMNYQGRLMTGEVPVTGTVSMSFAIFDDELSGSSLWSETHSLVVTDGIYSVKLGEIDDLDFPVSTENDLWMEVTIEGETVSPRQHLTASLFALRAADADTLGGRGSNEFTLLSEHENHTSDMDNPHRVTAAQVGAATLSDVIWTNLTGIPADIADGDQVGITAETDPTVPSTIKDGISWTEVTGRPEGLDDGDQVGITAETDPTVPSTIKDGISWTEVTGRPEGLDDGDQVGITTESDPTIPACADGEILRFNMQTGLWQCTSFNAADSFFTTHSGTGVLTIDSITEASPVIPHGSSVPDPYANIMVFDFTALDIVHTASLSVRISPLTILCDPKEKGPLILEKIALRQQLAEITLWLPDGTGVLNKFVTIYNAIILSQKTISPERPGDQSLIQYSIEGELIKVFGYYFNDPQSEVTYNVPDKTVSGGCGDVLTDFVLDYGLNSSLPGDRIDTIQSDVSSEIGNVDFGTIGITSSLNNHSLCLIANSLGFYHQTELSIVTPSAINPDSVESELTLWEANVDTYKIVLDSHGIPKQQFSFSFDKIRTSYGQVEFGWDIRAGGPF